MKALLIADDDDVIKKIQTALSEDGFDVITYRWLLKALDNIEEISPEAIIVSASSYPRHWKTLAQFVKSEITGFVPKIILYSERDFSEEDIKKSEILGIDGIFYSVESEGLKELADILSGNNKPVSLIFTNKESGAFITGRVLKFEKHIISFIPDLPSLVSSLKTDEEITHATIKNKNSIQYIKAKILSKSEDNKKLEIQVI